jgi:hypothetical protein
VFELGESKAKRARDNYSSNTGTGQESTAPTVSVLCCTLTNNTVTFITDNTALC